MKRYVDNDQAPASLPLSKLRGLPNAARVALKVRRINSCAQLLAVAATPEARQRLCAETGLSEALVLSLVCRADMARVRGVGAVFGMMLEDLDVADVGRLAAAEAAELHEKLRIYNDEERIARRSPTFDEVTEWILQARGLPPLVS